MRQTSTPRIAIFGAGLSGICLAIQLRKAGIETFTIFEKSDGVGGTWRDNGYPGAACDVPSMFYSFSFEVKPAFRASSCSTGRTPTSATTRSSS